jgi:alpha-galactosidase
MSSYAAATCLVLPLGGGLCAVWGNWTPPGGIITAKLGAVSTGAGTMNVFAPGQDNQLWEKSFSWGGWGPLGGILAAGTGPDPATNGLGKIEVFLEGQDNQLWGKSFLGGVWGAFVPEGGIVKGSPGSVGQSATEVDVFVRGGEGALYWSAVGTF